MWNVGTFKCMHIMQQMCQHFQQKVTTFQLESTFTQRTSTFASVIFKGKNMIVQVLILAFLL